MKNSYDTDGFSRRKVLTVDDHFIVNVGLKMLIERMPGFTICGQVTSASEALSLAGKHRPDVVVLDIVLGSTDGLELMHDIRQVSGRSQFLIYTSHDEGSHGWRALRAGATGYVMKSARAEDIGEALLKVSRGQTYASADLQRLMVDRMVGRKQVERSLAVLSDRELHVFRLLGQGKSSAAIAAAIHLSPTTVGTYRERIKQKLVFKDGRELEFAARHFQQTGALPSLAL